MGISISIFSPIVKFILGIIKKIKGDSDNSYDYMMSLSNYAESVYKELLIKPLIIEIDINRIIGLRDKVLNLPIKTRKIKLNKVQQEILKDVEDNKQELINLVEMFIVFDDDKMALSSIKIDSKQQTLERENYILEKQIN